MPVTESIQSQAIDWFIAFDTEPADMVLHDQFQHWLDSNPDHITAYEQVCQQWQRPELTLAALKLEQTRQIRLTKASANIRTLPAAKPRRRFFSMSAAVAACLLFSLTFLLDLPTRIRSDYYASQPEWVKLEDGSQIHLDKGTGISVSYSDEQRLINLHKGQAFFDVARNTVKPFMVQADEARVRVLGTAFNVRLEEEKTTVAVSHGKVEFKSSNNPQDSLILTSDQSAHLSSGKLERLSSLAIDPFAWQNNRLTFHDASLKEVLVELSRHLSGKLIFNDNDPRFRMKVTGSYELSNPSAVLASLASISGSSVQNVTGLVQRVYFK